MNIKSVYQKITNFFYSQKNKERDSSNENMFSVLVSLKNNFEIDLIVYIQDEQHETLSDIEQAIVYSEFLTSAFTDKMKKQIMDVINTQIKNESNSSLIENIETVEKISKSTKNINDNTFIQPSQVFSQYLT